MRWLVSSQLSIYLSTYLSVYLDIYLFIYLSIYLFVEDSDEMDGLVDMDVDVETERNRVLTSLPGDNVLQVYIGQLSLYLFIYLSI